MVAFGASKSLKLDLIDEKMNVPMKWQNCKNSYLQVFIIKLFFIGSDGIDHWAY